VFVTHNVARFFPFFKEFVMNLFAEASESNPIGFLIVLLLMLMGIRQWGIWLRGNSIVRGAAKKGILSILGRLFK
jgi:uncharacterized membrane protein YecN with MAPEG domain